MIKFLKEQWAIGALLVGSVGLVASGFFFGRAARPPAPAAPADEAVMERAVIPSRGQMLPIHWGTLSEQLLALGVIDPKKMAVPSLADPVRIDMTNAHALLNLLWALGLANDNPILTQGPMMDKQYGGAGSFASTGGWTLATGSPMDHYARHHLITLTPEQQALVERVAKTIYRPCCNNSTYFPDCNHGMAMLGLLELMASQGVNEQEMYRAALAVNSYWFPDTYLNIARYEQQQGISWDKVDPRIILGPDFSSASGYQRILQQVAPQGQSNGGSCGV